MTEWLTYDEMAARLGISAEAVRCRAKRQRWPRTRGNDGKARVQLSDEYFDRARPPGDPRATGGHDRAHDRPVEHPYERPENSLDSASERLVAALEAHVATLKAELEYARSELAAEREAALTAIRDYQRVANELASMKAGHAVPAAPSEAAVKRAENLVDILQRMRERQASKSA